MNNLDFNELRKRVTDDKIKKVLLQYDAKSSYENEKYMIFPTVCHNISGGSNKLYFYKDSRMFKCYTECEGLFDIFELLIKIYKLRGQDITIFDAIKICDVQYDDFFAEKKIDVQEDINFLYNLMHTKNKIVELPQLDEAILGRFIFDEDVLKIWEQEGISLDTMHKYSIAYDPIENCIIIPNFDINSNLISIRGRFLSDDAVAKYKPIIYNQQILSHPSSLALYGLNITKQAIQKKKQAIIFESEKSVLMMDTYYGDASNAVATLGKNISMQQIKLLYKLGVNEIVLAYDADYRDYNEMAVKRDEYIKIANTLKPYFNVCILLDLDFNLLRYKDSPIDRGKEIFEQILKNRIYV